MNHERFRAMILEIVLEPVKNKNLPMDSYTIKRANEIADQVIEAWEQISADESSFQ